MEILTELNQEKHRCINGRLVAVCSKACYQDLQSRIEDAVFSRDKCAHRSDERTYYNGMLSVFRRRLRSVKKDLCAKGILKESFERVDYQNNLIDLREASRIRKLAGLL